MNVRIRLSTTNVTVDYAIVRIMVSIIHIFGITCVRTHVCTYDVNSYKIHTNGLLFWKSQIYDIYPETGGCSVLIVSQFCVACFCLMCKLQVLHYFQVFDFFKRRIEEQYPLPDGDLDPYQQIKEQHESFMKNRSENVMGREESLQKVVKMLRLIPYITSWWRHKNETISCHRAFWPPRTSWSSSQIAQ